MNPQMIVVGVAAAFGLGLLIIGRYWVRDLLMVVRANQSGFIKPGSSGRTLFRATDPTAFQKAIRKLTIRLAIVVWPLLACAIGGTGLVLALADF